MGYEPISLILAYFSVLRLVYYILVHGARWLLMLDGDSLVLLDVTKLVYTTYFILSRWPFNQAYHFFFVFCCY